VATDPRLVDLILRWEELREQGQSVTAEELCRDCPELLPEVRRAIQVLLALKPLCGTSDQPTPRSTDTGIGGGEAAAEGAWTAAAGRYQQAGFHARGGLGEIHLGEDLELHRPVALKRIQEQQDSADNRRRFLREAEITARLQHPGIVPVYGLVHDDQGRPCYAMRFIKGDSLHDALGRFHAADRPGRDPGERNLALRRLLTRFVAVCKTLAYAHSRGIMHLDVKPGNIMLGSYDETLVVDWGLARPFAQRGPERSDAEEALLPVSDRGDVTRQLGQAPGTPPYMSPEQAAGRWDAIGPASDVYSLGATLYCLLTGRPPFAGSTAEILRKVQQSAFPPPRQVKPATPRALEAVCLKAMAHRPEERYARASELAADLERWLGDEPVRAYPEPVGDRMVRWGRRYRTAVVAGAIAVAFVLLSIPGGLFLWQRAEQRRHAHLADLHISAIGSEALALDEVHAGRFDQAEDILQKAISRIENEPALTDDRSRMEAEHDRAQRLAAFYRLADEAERLEAEQSTRPDNLADSGAGALCEKGLRRLGVFQHEKWWEHLPYEELEDRQRDDLKEDVYWYLLGLAAMRVKGGLGKIGSSEGNAIFRQALEAVAAAKRLNPQEWAVTHIEAVIRAGMGENGALNQFAAGEPSSAIDHYIIGMVYLGLYIVTDPAEGRPQLEQVLLPRAVALLGLDMTNPGARSEHHFRLAAALQPRHYWAHCWLGYTLRKEGQSQAAELAWNTCVALRPRYATGYHFRSGAILDQWSQATDPKIKERLFDLGLADLRKVIELDPADAGARSDLGTALKRQGKLDEAMGHYREAIKLQPDYAPAHLNLGLALLQQGRFVDALAALKRGQALAANRPRPRDQAAAWVRETERLIVLDGRLPALLKGEARPAAPEEMIEFARLCLEYKRLPAAALRLYQDAFSARPQLAADPKTGHRFNAARAAAQCGSGRGQDAATLDEKERARGRKQAVEWLAADLAVWAKLTAGGPPTVRTQAERWLAAWQAHPDFAGLREPPALAKLPEDERKACQKLWADVAALLRQVRGTAKPAPEKPAKGAEKT
jgi:serine/threonine protein kinase/Flp pilus assembly protein TadD